MIDKITSRIKRYPFQTGILVGFVICLALIGFISLFQDNGKTLSGNSEIIREDYLRMSINEYSGNRDQQLAGWRFGHLGKAGDATLKLMTGDESISPQILALFAEAIGKENVLKNGGGNNNSTSGTPVNPKKGLSGFGKTLLIVLGLIVISAGGLYAASLVKTRRKQKMRSERKLNPDEETVNVITPEKARAVTPDTSDTPDTLFDLDELFPQNSETEEKYEDKNMFSPINDKDSSDVNSDNENSGNTQEQETIQEDNNDSENETAGDQDKDEKDTEIINDNILTDTKSLPVQSENDNDNESDNDDEQEKEAELTGNSKSELDIEPSVHDIGEEIKFMPEENPEEAGETAELKSDTESEEENTENDDADKPLVETDIMTDPNSDDELLQMIRSSKTNSNVLDEKEIAEGPVSKNADDPEADTDNEIKETSDENTDEENGEEDDQDDVLIHYQSTYRIGNDMYDEVFSIDQGDVFRGECGISIGETLNNTEPKAVTAFEIWLFDKDDIHTTTWYMMSDFAITNESISERLLQHGKCERIRKNGKYTLETETLMVDITVLELEYGTEMEEKNSYFTYVTFDVVARSKN